MPRGFSLLGSVEAHCTLTEGARRLHGEWLSDVDCSVSRLVQAMKERAADVGGELLVGRVCTSQQLPPGSARKRTRIDCSAEAARPDDDTLESRAPACGREAGPMTPAAAEAWRIRVEFTPAPHMPSRAPRARRSPCARSGCSRPVTCASRRRDRALSRGLHARGRARRRAHRRRSHGRERRRGRALRRARSRLAVQWRGRKLRGSTGVPVAGVLVAAMDILLVRHGESEGNRLGRRQGHKEGLPAQPERGVAQAAPPRRLAPSWPQKVTWDAAYASPLSRASETAAIIA